MSASDPESSQTPHSRPSRSPPRIPGHTLLRLIARGAYGEVWLARNATNTLRAVKIVYRGRFEHDRPYEREWEGMQKFEPVSRAHPGFVDILQIERNDAEEYFYYIMELADNRGEPVSSPASKPEDQGSAKASFTEFDREAYSPRTLRSEIHRCGRLPVGQCVQLGLALTEALDYLHGQGLVHRDIKPSNIIFIEGTPKLADIGLVTRAGEGGSLVGTEGYVPPEGPGTPRADIYCLGLVLYELATGQSCKDYPNPLPKAAENAELQELYQVIFKACETDPQKRYVSAARMGDDLQLLMHGKSLQRLRKLERAFVLAIYAAIAAVVLGLSGFFVQRFKAAQTQEKLKRAESREQMQRRQVLLQQLQMTRMGLHRDGWSALVVDQIRQAASLEADAGLRNQAVATLTGLDARLVRLFTNFNAASVAFEPGGRRLLIGGFTEGAKLWNQSTEEVNISGLAGPGPVAFAADGTPLNFVFKEHGTFVLWNVMKQRVIREFRIESPLAAGSWPQYVDVPMTITPDGLLVAAAAAFSDGRGRYAVWETATGRLILEVSEKIFSLAFSPDGSLLAAGDDNGRIAVWALARGEKVAELQDGQMSVRSLTFHRDMKMSPANTSNQPNWLVAAGDEVGLVSIWDVGKRGVRIRMAGSHFHIYCVAFSPDGTLLASAGRYETRVWDVAHGQLLLTLPGGDFYSCLAFSPDGKGLAASSKKVFGEGHGWIWDLEAGRGIQPLWGLSSPISRIGFSPDGKLIAALANNWEIGIWEVATGRLLHIIETPKGDIADLAQLTFSADDSRLAFAAGTTASLYDVPTGRQLQAWDFSNEGFVELTQGFIPLVFHGAAELLLIEVRRVETNSDTTSPNGERRRDSVLRLRNLVNSQPTGSSPEIALTNFVIHCVIVPAAGQSLIVEGLSIKGKAWEKNIRVLSENTLQQLWSVPWAATCLNMAVDSAGSVLAYEVQKDTLTQLVELQSGELMRTQRGIPLAVSPGAKNWICSRLTDTVFDLFANDREVPLFSLEFGSVHWNFTPGFSSDGNLLAWANPEGTIAVCDLQEVRRHLARLGLDW